MPTRDEYEQLLLKAQTAHREFREAVKAARSKGQRQRRKSSQKVKGPATGQNPSNVLELKRDAYSKFTYAWYALVKALAKQLKNGSSTAVGQAIEFLATDVQAPNSGYMKEELCRRLKKVYLSDEEVERLKEIALKRCVSNEYRREDTELWRLMIRLADKQFLNKASTIPARKGSRTELHRNRMLETILRNRKDLRDQIVKEE